MFSFLLITEGQKHDLYVLLMMFDVQSSHSLSEYVSVFIDNFAFNESCNLIFGCRCLQHLHRHRFSCVCLFPDLVPFRIIQKGYTETSSLSLLFPVTHLYPFYPVYSVILSSSKIKMCVIRCILSCLFLLICSCLFLLLLLLSLSRFRSPVFLPLISSCFSSFCPLSC